MVSSGRRAVFLDRDGVLVVPEFRAGRSFAVRDLNNFQLYPEAEESLCRLKEDGFLLVVVTNQPDVGRGLVATTVLDEMHRRLKARLPIDRIETCIHQPSDCCNCRKPRPGMILSAAAALGIDLGRSFMVGDRATDIVAGHLAGCRTVFIDLGYSAEAAPEASEWSVGSIGEAAALISMVAREGKANDVATR